MTIKDTMIRDIDSIIEGLKEDDLHYEEYEKSILQLTAMGYDSNYVEYIHNKGMEYIPEVNGLLKATSAQVTEINDLWKKRSSGGSGGDEDTDLIPSHVGEVIMSTVLSTAAAVQKLYGGTWQAWGAGRMPLSISSRYYVNQTGGEASHTLTVSEMPSHTHDLWGYGPVLAQGSYGWRLGSSGTQTATGIIKYTGGGGSHNNMPPYQVVYMWQRTA